MKALYVEAVRRRFWANTPQGALDFFALGDKALQDDGQGTPGKLFYSLVKAKRTERITNALEGSAMRRLPSADREELVTRAGAALPAKRQDREEAVVDLFGGEGGRRIGYQHAVMMMTFLPQKRTKDRVHTARHGRAALRIEAGTLANPRAVGEFRECPLPHGSRARLIVPYINAYAVRHSTRNIDMGRSLRDFLVDSLGLSWSGRQGKALTEQVEAVAAAQFTLGQWHGDQVETKYGRVSDSVSFWLERDAGQALLWEPSMTLSEGYYHALRDRLVPVDLGHLLKLTHSPRRMDLYSWLAYRTAMIARGKGVWIRLSDLRRVFAPDIDEANQRLFRQRLRRDLAAIADVYSGFRVRIEGDALVLERSPPPIPALPIRSPKA